MWPVCGRICPCLDTCTYYVRVYVSAYSMHVCMYVAAHIVQPECNIHKHSILHTTRLTQTSTYTQRSKLLVRVAASRDLSIVTFANMTDATAGTDTAAFDALPGYACVFVLFCSLARGGVCMHASNLYNTSCVEYLYGRNVDVCMHVCMYVCMHVGERTMFTSRGWWWILFKRTCEQAKRIMYPRACAFVYLYGNWLQFVHPFVNYAMYLCICF
jgi:hypothetical protein